MQTDNIVFRKIKEISARGMHPRPAVPIVQLAHELSVSAASLVLPLTQLKQLRLVNIHGSADACVKLTLLGSVVNRDK